MKKIGVIGAGTMGTGIAHVSALSGFDVTLVDIEQNLLEHSLTSIKKGLKRQVDKGKISQEEMNTALGRIQTITEMKSLSSEDIVIEAATENKEVKISIFSELDTFCPEKTILASNTSSISISLIASATNRPEKVIGMHFMNPVSIMKLVEIIRGKLTSDETTKKVKNLVEVLNKIPVECNDSSGFVSNRILMPMINEAVFCLADGVATAEAIDKIMTVGMAHPMGPLTLADLIGLDICLAIMEVLHRDMGDNKYRPCPLLEEMVSAGNLGRKTGQGFYSY
ncbi:MAG TPA: 3-hydroxybutyryl-CoA dehydrogenase [Muricauda sp.]|jgi:3-hydroxybutyryl-CoA dehydrogenase|nr:3-hydroxybutyryl-CoA dehydrogenase [Allomuricauda sp.]HCN24124.1 3-hydroxybutyryl-CoA dehydrogenase [Candidatus Neomarinimicrobiota bacterium]|tara:strand:+ start:1041 stop:1883 length:843 start_codon:yes stop_codon:yes gene_type:complete